MARASNLARRHVDLAWISLGISDELRDRASWNRWIHQHDVGHDNNAGDRRDVADEIEVELVIECRVDRVRGGGQEESVAVGRRAHDRLGADIGAATRPLSITNCWPSRSDSH